LFEDIKKKTTNMNGRKEEAFMLEDIDQETLESGAEG
jgi:hypothetical protein